MVDVFKELGRRLTKPKPGGVLLFTGAGFSSGAINNQNQEIPRAREFSQKLGPLVGESEEISLDVIADIYNESLPGGKTFLDLIRATFTVKSDTEAHRKIMSYPWRRVYTTNYDDLAEFALGRVGSLPEVYDRNTIPNSLSGNSLQIIHLNGYVKSINNKTVVDDFALTLSKYIDDSLFSSRWASLLRQDFQLADTIIFIGYSMYDLDISRILTQDPAIKSKTFLVQHDKISRGEEMQLGRFGSVITIGVDGVASLINSCIDAGVAKSKADLENFREFIPPNAPATRSVQTKDLQLLLERGIFETELYYSQLEKGSSSYIVNRNICNQVVSSLNNSQSTVVIHSDIGNGKSLLIEQFKKLALSLNFRIFEFDPSDENFSFDINYFNELEENYVLIIDDLITNRSVIDTLRNHLTNFRILSSVRSSIFEIKSSDIKDILGSTFVAIDGNFIEPSDYDDLFSILTKGGYWGDRHADSLKSKRKFISKDCKNQIRSVLVGLLDKPAVQSRLKVLFDKSWRSDPDLRAIFAVALCLNVIEETPSLRNISELLSTDAFKKISNDDSALVKEFFSLEKNEMRARSAIISEYIIHEFISDQELSDIIYRCLVGCQSKRGVRVFREISKKLMRFSFVEKALGGDGNVSTKIIDFYDRVGDIGFRNNNPQYWLQYAIASLSFGDYPSADRQFVTAFSLAMDFKSGYNTYQIDNQYARFLLESRTNVDIWNDYYDSFKRSHILIMGQMKDVEQGYYPYRVAKLYGDFMDKRSKEFNRVQLADVKAACGDMLNHINTSVEKVRKNRFVKDARVQISAAIDAIEDAQKKRGW